MPKRKNIITGSQPESSIEDTESESLLAVNVKSEANPEDQLLLKCHIKLEPGMEDDLHAEHTDDEYIIKSEDEALGHHCTIKEKAPDALVFAEGAGAGPSCSMGEPDIHGHAAGVGEWYDQRPNHGRVDDVINAILGEENGEIPPSQKKPKLKMFTSNDVRSRDIIDSVNVLLQVESMSVEAALEWVKQFFIRVNNWITREAGKEVLLTTKEVEQGFTSIAIGMGKSYFRLADTWFTRFRSNHFLMFKVEFPPSKLSCLDVTALFIEEVNEAYVVESSKGVMSPMQFEEMSFQVSKINNITNFYPNKEFVQRFVERHGFYCSINGNVEKLMKGDGSVLNYYFNAVFEMWYHDLPVRLDEVKVGEWNYVDMRRWGSYLRALLKRYVYETSRSKSLVLEESIEQMECETAKELGGEEGAGAYLTVCNKWCQQCQCMMDRVRMFNTAIQKWYKDTSPARMNIFRNIKDNIEMQKKVFMVGPDELKENSELIAKKTNLQYFRPTRKWLKRFLEINGLAYQKYGECELLQPNDLLQIGVDEWGSLFEEWYEGKTSVWGVLDNGTWLKNLMESSPTVESSPVIGSSPAIKSSPEIKSLPVMESSLATKSPNMRYLQVVESSARAKQILKEFNSAVALWCQDHINQGKHLVARQVLDKAEEVATSMGVSNFVASKSWLCKLFKRQGIYSLRGTKRLALFSIEGALTENVETCFNVVFERWYMNTSKLNATYKTKLQILHSITDVDALICSWYMNECSRRLVTANMLEKKAVVIAKNVGADDFEFSKEWVKAFVERHGLPCSINGAPRLLLKAGVGVLEHYFNAAFNVWYFELPVPLDPTNIQDEEIETHKVNVTKFWSSLMEWYVVESHKRDIPTKEILMKDTQIALDMDSRNKQAGRKRMPSFSKIALGIAAWYRQLAKQLSLFDDSITMWAANVRRLIKPSELVRKAEYIAIELGIPHFEATEDWMKRCMELFGLRALSRYGFDCVSANS